LGDQQGKRCHEGEAQRDTVRRFSQCRPRGNCAMDASTVRPDKELLHKRAARPAFGEA
jgi:hypothetical protein